MCSIVQGFNLFIGDWSQSSVEEILNGENKMSGVVFFTLFFQASSDELMSSLLVSMSLDSDKVLSAGIDRHSV